MVNKIIKFIFIGLLSIFTILFIVLSSLNKNQYLIPTSYIQKLVNQYDSSFIVDATNAKVIIDNYKIILAADSLRIHKVNNKDIILSDINAVIRPFLLKSKIILQIKDLPLNHFMQLHENQNLTVFIDNFFLHNYLVCSGDVMFGYSVFKPERIEVNLYSNDGWHDPKVANLKKLQLKEFDLNLRFYKDKITISKFYLSYIDSFEVALSGDFSFSGDELLLAEFQTNLTMFPIDYLAGFWHPHIFNATQKWVTKNIQQGIVKRAQAKFKFTEEDFESPMLPKGSIDVNMDIENIDLVYLPEYSPIQKITGNLKIDGSGIYLDNATALMDNGQLDNIKLALPFESFVLSLKANTFGEISSFKKFIPEDLVQKLAKFGVEYGSIKGQAKASVSLDIPVLNSFKATNMLLYIKADLSNVVLDKKQTIKFASGTLSVSNDADQIKFELFSKDLISIVFESTHAMENKTFFSAEITNKENFIIEDKVTVKGKVKAQLNATKQDWQFNLNLDQAEVILLPVTFHKLAEVPFNLECSGEFIQDNVIGKTCNIFGKDIRGEGKFVYSANEGRITQVELADVKIGPNNFGFSVSYDKNAYWYKLNARYLDLSNFSPSPLLSGSKDKSNYNVELKIDKAVLKNKNSLNDIKAKIISYDKKPLEIEAQAFDQSKKLTISKISKNNEIGYLLYCNDASTFAQNFGIYQNIKKGELWLEIHPKKNQNNISYYGTLKLSHFFFTNTSALTKVILGVTSALNSPDALLRALQGGSLQSDSFEADIKYDQGILSINNGDIKGPSYEVKLGGYFDIENSKLNFKGIYIPSMFGINKFVSGIPIVGSLISGGKDSALIGANFSITGDTKKPDISFNPLSVLTPGFLRNIF